MSIKTVASKYGGVIATPSATDQSFLSPPPFASCGASKQQQQPQRLLSRLVFFLLLFTFTRRVRSRTVSANCNASRFAELELDFDPSAPLSYLIRFSHTVTRVASLQLLERVVSVHFRAPENLGTRFTRFVLAFSTSPPTSNSNLSNPP